VNKMDLIDWSERRFREIETEFIAFCAKLGIPDPIVVPISALTGENVVSRGTNTPWYSGSPILELLESVPIRHPAADAPFRMPVQYVIRPSLDFRGFAGTIASGSVKVGDRVRILPSGRETRVRRIARAPEDGGDLSIAVAPQSVVMTLESEVDCSRGDVIAGIGGACEMIVAQSIEADVVWMDEAPLMAGKMVMLKHATKVTAARVIRVRHRVDVNTLQTHVADTLSLNDIGRIEIETELPLSFDPYRKVRQMGAIILIDRTTNATAAAGMIRTGDAADPHAKRAHWETAPISSVEAPVGQSLVSDRERSDRWRQKPTAILFHGPSGSGKTRGAFALERALWQRGHAAIVLDGQMLRAGISRDLSFTDEDRSENLRRAAEFARILMDQGFVVILSMGAPQEKARELAQQLIGAERFMAVDCTHESSKDSGAVLQRVVDRITPS